MSRETLRHLFIPLACIGVLLSAYLLKLHFTPQGSFCDINDTFNCATVNASGYAVVFGVPVALLGMLHYLFLLIASLLPVTLARLLRLDARTYYLGLTYYMALGLIFSAYLTFVEAFVLFAYCVLCVTSAIITLVQFFLAFRLWRTA